MILATAGNSSANASPGPTVSPGSDGGAGGAQQSGAAGAQPQDWSAIWACFEEPYGLLAPGAGLNKGMQVY